MPPDQQSGPRFEIGHVLFIDIVGYSKGLISEQSESLQKLKEIVRGTEQFRLAEAEGKLVRLPTGDGMALVFRSSPEAPAQCALELSRSLQAHPELSVRMGIHSGPVNEVADVNERTNITGSGINMAQRVMDCGDAGHILFSKRVADDLEQYPQWRPHLHELGECEVKHGRKVTLVNFYTDEIGNPEPPKRCLLPKEQPATEKTLSSVLQASAKSIAVLPFENLSHDPDNAYFADGIQQEILTRLSKIADLKVISRTSTQRYKRAPANLLEIAQQLGVANVVEGTVQKAGDQVRVNVQLINAVNDSHLWGETYDRKLIDIFSVESEIAAKIADALHAKLTGGEQKAIASRPTENTEAHQAYLKGLYYWNRFLAPNFEKSCGYFQQAIALDPAYALAHSGVSLYYSFAVANGLMAPDEGWPKSEAAVNKALALDETLAEAYNPLAALQLYRYRDWPAAERAFRRGIELNPNFAENHHHYALCLILFERNGDALIEVQRAVELEPLSSRFNLNWARILFFIRQYDRAIEQFRTTVELDPNYALPHEWFGYAYEKKRMHKEAIAEWSTALTLSGASELAVILNRSYAASGFDAAVRALAQERLEALNKRTARGEYVPAVEYALAYDRADDKEQAFAWLAKAVAERNRFALEFKINPLFDALRNDPRFQKLCEEKQP